MKATALPTPSEVASAWRNVSPNRGVVSSLRWIAVVQMTRIRVRTFAARSETIVCQHAHPRDLRRTRGNRKTWCNYVCRRSC